MIPSISFNENGFSFPLAHLMMRLGDVLPGG